MSEIVLPEEIVEYIISFTVDRRGYNIIKYNERKRLNWMNMNRLVVEIDYFNELDVSVCWLKPSRKQLGNIKKFKESLKQGNPRVTYHIGCYSSIHSEKSANALLAYKIEKL